MYVYVSQNWNIIMKSSFKRPWVQNKYKEFIVEYDQMDNLIYEDGKIKRYENSRQYIEDTNRYHLEKELNEEKRKNKELLTIANTKVKKEMELEVKGQEPDEYQRKLYLLKNMRWLPHS